MIVYIDGETPSTSSLTLFADARIDTASSYGLSHRELVYDLVGTAIYINITPPRSR